MKKLKVGSKVIIKDDNESLLPVGSQHTITGRLRNKEHGEVVWIIKENGEWLFRRSQLIPVTDVKIEFE